MDRVAEHVHAVAQERIFLGFRSKNREVVTFRAFCPPLRLATIALFRPGSSQVALVLLLSRLILYP